VAGALLAIVCCTIAAIVVRYLTTAPRKPCGTESAARSGDSLALPGSSQNKDNTERIWGAGLTKLEAEDLLDWLEANGHKGELTFFPDKGYTVRESSRIT
jgi:hypothetical protein